MPYYELPLASMNAKPLYVCGDSHCAPLAWQSVQFQGEKHQLHPLLVTGMKIWHLRPDSSFYNKVQFYNVLKGGGQSLRILLFPLWLGP